ncbi:hypothetical protein DH2020_007636 [Rehmannia glutinosa]|uniref:Uncharacterized protein n=1 Tax=Rehmannia glutinosa TaxID=99300 RepID=A0ABR0TZ02_REHGL
MEESEKRRERLKAMRMEAAQTGKYTDFESPGLASGGLSNPLIESETASASPLQYSSPRFDFYTDPMSAFSGSKTRNNISPQVSQGQYDTPPIYHYPPVNSPGQRIYQAPAAHFHQSPVRSPMGPASPLGGPHENPPTAWRGSGGAFNYNTPPNMSRGGNFTSPGFTQGNPPYFNYGRGGGRQGYNSNSHYDSGRGGRGRTFGNRMSPGSGSSGWRGAGSREPVSAEQRPDLYYRKEMVEDPWMSLSPVVWKVVDALDSNKSWLPKSIGVKKSKISSKAPQTSISQQSLAEYLAASFDDSADDERGE